jgi:hypothetical protein
MASNQRNPVYDSPDAHELRIMELASSLGHFRLVESTRAARRARASYWRKVARSMAAAGQVPASGQVETADASAVV